MKFAITTFFALFVFASCATTNCKAIVFKGWQALCQENMLMQKKDFSCGAAALATLMNYFGDQISENELIEDILANLSQSEVQNRQEEGLSLLDLKQAALRRGFQVLGVKLQYSQLSKIPCPILVYLEIEEYKHFAVFNGVQGNQVLLADPSTGNKEIHVSQFVKDWKGNMALILYKKGSTLKYPFPPYEILYPKTQAVKQILLRK